MQTHQANNLGGANDVIVVTLTVVGRAVQIPLHGPEEQIHVLTVDVVGFECFGECMQNRIAAHAMFERPVGVFFESFKHHGLLRSVKGIHDFIRVANKSVNVVYGRAQ